MPKKVRLFPITKFSSFVNCSPAATLPIVMLCLCIDIQMLEYLKKCHGFEDDNVTLLLDDGKHTSPTASNIMNAFGKIAAESKPGDVIFIHYRYVF